MKNVYVYCEGQTEEAFANGVLYPYFFAIDIYIRPIVCTTKRTQAKKYTGGVSDFFKIKNELIILCKQHKNELVTTMFDYYAMPTNTPLIGCTETDIFKRIALIEKAITAEIAQPNCFFGLTLHEFEGLLFSDPDAFRLIADSDTVTALHGVRSSFSSPELINNSPETAPSKRIEKLIPNYAKVKNGTIVSKEIGIDRLLAECRHFSQWVEGIKRSLVCK